jgi:hypothetical protein
MVKFVSGRYERAWVGNVVAIWQCEWFVEPLRPTIARAISVRRCLGRGAPGQRRQSTPSQIRMFNHEFGESMGQHSTFPCHSLSFSTRPANAFWDACRADTDLAARNRWSKFYTGEWSERFGPTLAPHPFANSRWMDG